MTSRAERAYQEAIAEARRVRREAIFRASVVCQEAMIQAREEYDKKTLPKRGEGSPSCGDGRPRLMRLAGKEVKRYAELERLLAGGQKR